jgi:hypothetical protein
MRLELQAGGGRGALGDYSTNVRRRRVIKTTAKTPIAREELAAQLMSWEWRPAAWRPETTAGTLSEWAASGRATARNDT